MTAIASLSKQTSADAPSAAAEVVRHDDARLSDARTPTAHAASHASGGGDPISPASIGAQPADSDLTTIAGLSPSNGDLMRRISGAWANQTLASFKTDLALTKSDVGLGNVDNLQQQPIDADLTTIAGLSPSNDDVLQRKAGAWTNRTLAQLRTDLALVVDAINDAATTTAPSQNAVFDALAGKQPLDSDLTTIAGLTPTTNNFMVAAASAWASRTPAQAKTALALVKADVGLGSVDNTADSAKPVSTAQAAADLLRAGGVIARGNRTAAATTTATTQAGARKVIEVGASVVSGRLYRISAPSVVLYADAADRTAIVQLTYTTNNTAPGVTSTVLLGASKALSYAASGADTGSYEGFFTPGSNHTLRVLLSYYGVEAATYTMHASATAPIQLIIEDCGVDPGDSGTDF